MNLKDALTKRGLDKYNNNPIVLLTISKLRDMFNIDFKLAEVNKFGSMQLVSEDKQIVCYHSAYSIRFHFKTFYGHTDTIVTDLSPDNIKHVVDRYIKVKTDVSYREFLSTDYSSIDYLKW